MRLCRENKKPYRATEFSDVIAARVTFPARFLLEAVFDADSVF
jgi:hypothetical protein